MRLIILGAGEGYKALNEQDSLPKAITAVSEGRTVLDVLNENFTTAGIDEIIFVGGFKIEKIIAAHPHIKSLYNPDWDKSNMLKSLSLATELISGDVFICYGDTLFSVDAIKEMLNGNQSIRIGIDENWLNRYEGRGDVLRNEAEKVISANKLLECIVSTKYDENVVSGEFTGLVYLNAAGSDYVRNTINEKLLTDKDFVQKSNLSQFLNHLVKAGQKIETIDIRGKWAELEAPQDIAQFVFGTKAETLARLHKLVTKSHIEDQVSFTLNDWNQKRDDIINAIQETFHKAKVVIRSSAIGEDSFESSNAGEFLSILNVDSENADTLIENIQKVFNSYHTTNGLHQCLVQPMLTNVKMSGVIFTRDLENGAPYYTINFEYSDKTDTITSGTSTASKTLIVYKHTKSEIDNPIFDDLIAAVREVEIIAGHDSLDIEFAQTDKGIHILQVRPLVANRKNRNISDEDFASEIKTIKEFITYYCNGNHLGVKGNVLANMPDWNPAEIVGTTPKPLAISLYQYVITDEVWRVQRKSFGYRDSFPQPLVITLAGQPYIDTKASFNSFIPASLKEATAQKLLKYYIERLAQNPELHDKVEFQIAFTCFSFDLKDRLNVLKDSGFSTTEIDEIFESLRTQTEEIINPKNNLIQNELNEIAALKSYDCDKVSNENPANFFLIYELLELCKSKGTLPFAKLARCAFIATDLLKSLVRLHVITVKEYDNFFNSLETVATDFTVGLNNLRAQKISLNDFLQKFGHLRPGTYDICSKRYDEAPEHYFGNNDSYIEAETHTQIHFELTAKQHQLITELLVESKLNITVEELMNFIKLSIINREYSKFIFTQKLSDAIKHIETIGTSLGIDREDLSYLSIENILLQIKNYQSNELIKDEYKDIIAKNKIKYLLTKGIKLPHHITNSKQVECFWQIDGKPNYITEKNITAEVVALNENSDSVSIKNKIVMIENADPGYDWIFGHGIKGLITVYGGANSHMAIRSAEFGLPAIIGCGEKIGNKLRKAKVVELNCGAQLIKVIS